MKPGPKPTKKDRLDALGTFTVVEMIIEGTTYRSIARSFGVSAATLVAWIESNSERSRACARAREMSAQAFEERAEEELRAARTPFQLAKARELAAHWRWRAKAVNPRQYGDRVDVNAAVTLREVSDSELVATLAEFGISVPLLGATGTPQLLERVHDGEYRPPYDEK